MFIFEYCGEFRPWSTGTLEHYVEISDAQWKRYKAAKNELQAIEDAIWAIFDED